MTGKPILPVDLFLSAYFNQQKRILMVHYMPMGIQNQPLCVYRFINTCNGVAPIDAIGVCSHA
jgi:hypothetical protein